MYILETTDSRMLGGCLLVCLLLTTAAAASEPRVAVEPAEKWCNVFGDANAIIHYTVRSDVAIEGRVQWSLSVNRRTVQRGEAAIKAAAGRAAEVEVALNVPAVRDGVIVEAALALAVYMAGEEKPSASHSKILWIFPRDPFVDRSEWLKELKITLFDPSGKTADVLEKARVPFVFTKNISALDELGEGLLLVGEDTSWKDCRGLDEALVKAAARGVPVLCLAPSEGIIALSGSADTESPSPMGLSLRREDVISELDKRLDAIAWPPNGGVAACRVALSSDRDRVVAEVTQARQAWPWLEARYTGKGRLVICGFGIVRQWDATPTARYLLSELFTRLTAEKQPVATPKDVKENR